MLAIDLPPPIPLGPPQGDLLQLLGALYGAASIIVVFQMFSLQIWLQRVYELDDASFDAEQKTMVGSLERRSLAERIRSHRRSFPWIQIIGCGSALVVLLAVSAAITARVTELDWYFTIGPVVVLSLTFLGATIGTVVRGFRLAGEASSRII
jgi:hypothetical protein